MADSASLRWKDITPTSNVAAVAQGRTGMAQTNRGFEQILGVVKDQAKDYKNEVTSNITNSISSIGSINELNALRNSSLSDANLMREYGDNYNKKDVESAINSHKAKLEDNLVGNVLGSVAKASASGANQRDINNLIGSALGSLQGEGVSNNKLLSTYKTLSGLGQKMSEETPAEKANRQAKLQYDASRFSIQQEQDAAKFASSVAGETKALSDMDAVYGQDAFTADALKRSNNNAVDILAENRKEAAWYRGPWQAEFDRENLNKTFNDISKDTGIPRGELDAMITPILKYEGLIGAKGAELNDIDTPALDKLIRSRIGGAKEYLNRQAKLKNQKYNFQSNQLQKKSDYISNLFKNTLR